MGKPRYAAKNDSNQEAIVSALRAIPGVSVATGHDDFIVGYRGDNFWYECKNPDEIAKKTGQPFNRKRKTHQDQQELKESWTGHYKIVWTLGQILEDMGIE